MKTDLSLTLYRNYFKLKNPLIEVELKNHHVLTGKFIGFFRGTTTYISKWQLVEAHVLFSRDAFGFLVGQLIPHQDILKITFLEDHSIMNF